jgi:serine protease
MRALVLTTVIVIAAGAAASASDTELNPVRTHPRTVSESAVQQVIVKLRASAPGTRMHAQTSEDRIAALALRAGLTVDQHRAITNELHVLSVEPGLPGENTAATLARLRADGDVEYAEPDQRRYPHAMPNDTLYQQQWYMLPSSATTPSAVDAQTAWDTTTGGNVVIADLDTGVRFDHPDLLAIAMSGRLLPGYDFITDVFVANDGDGRDADPSDPGDWVTSSDLSKPECSSTKQTANSSWHGTRTAGILGALTNNGQGIAGMTWTSQILPVRVLGKCGGTDSDIIAGMLWAAGIDVSGVPHNANPAKIINMSLGSSGACLQDYQDAITQITARGALIVISAGNEGGPVDTPANCPGVAGIAGLRQAGTKVGFSSLGPEVTVSAPAGNCVNTTIGPGSPCLYSIETTFNLGTTVPAQNGYTDQVANLNLGTSFSAPIVSGIAALMAAANPNLGTCQLIARLKEGAQPFPQSSVGESPQPPMCHVPANANDLQDAECICTLDGQTCGAGMASASGSIKAALRPIATVTVPASVAAGQSLTLQGVATAALNHTISTYQWSNVSGVNVPIQNATSAAASVTLPSCGLSTVRLTVADDAGNQDTADVVLSPNSATTTADSTQSGSCALSTPAIEVAVCPQTDSINAGASQSFSATLANTSNAAVTWQVNGIAGGNATVGTISGTGMYTAPTAVPSPATVTVTAVSAADTTRSAAAQLTITAPAPSKSGGGGSLEWLTLAALTFCWGVARRSSAR